MYDVQVLIPSSKSLISKKVLVPRSKNPLSKKKDTLRYLLSIINFYWNWALLISFNYKYIVF